MSAKRRQRAAAGASKNTHAARFAGGLNTIVARWTRWTRPSTSRQHENADPDAELQVLLLPSRATLSSRLYAVKYQLLQKPRQDSGGRGYPKPTYSAWHKHAGEGRRPHACVQGRPFRFTSRPASHSAESRRAHTITPRHSTPRGKSNQPPFQTPTKKECAVQQYCIPDGEVSPQATSISHPNTHSAPC